MKLLIALSILSCFVSWSAAQGGKCPNGWAKFKDEKCFMLKSNFTNYSDAQKACVSEGGSLGLIKEQEQQEFLTNFIFNSSKVEVGVWIGATRKSETNFEWQDASKVEYSNWDVDRPSAIEGRNCVAMHSRLSKAGNNLDDKDGKWNDVSCNSAYYFVCETEPTWSLDDIKRVLIETRKTLEGTVGKLEDLQRNPVPVGFIYYQHHGQPDASTLWPQVTWKDVTSAYAGLFFRAYGAGSAEFGSIQEANSSRLINVQSAYISDPGDPVLYITSNPGTWSEYIWTGYGYYPKEGKGEYNVMRFLVSNAEERPRNAAIRIWRRES